MARNVGTGPKRAMDSKKASTNAAETVIFLDLDVSRFDDTIPETFPFGYRSSALFEDFAWKEGIVNSWMSFLLRDAALELQCVSLSVHLQSCMIDRKHRAFVFLEVEDVVLKVCCMT